VQRGFRRALGVASYPPCTGGRSTRCISQSVNFCPAARASLTHFTLSSRGTGMTTTTRSFLSSFSISHCSNCARTGVDVVPSIIYAGQLTPRLPETTKATSVAFFFPSRNHLISANIRVRFLKAFRPVFKAALLNCGAAGVLRSGAVY
jgi:hypothetical protein